MCRMKRSNFIHMKEKLTLSDFSKSQLPLISVVVPVHNSARYLKKSAESIAAQTYKNLEILLVDDGSSDESSEIIESIARQDDRFRTIHALKSHGVSAARNSAIQAAKGTWICSADSDDIVPPQGIETLFLAVMEHGTRMAMGAYRECHVTQHMRFTRPVPAKPGVFNTPRELQKYFLTSGVNFNHMWTKIFHRDAFASARFPVGMIYEDIYLLPHLLDAAGSGAVVNRFVYNYYVRLNSTSTNVNIRQQMDGIHARFATVKYMEKHYPEFVPLANDSVFFMGCNVLGKIDHIGGREAAPQEWDETLRLMNLALENSSPDNPLNRAEAMALRGDPKLVSKLSHFVLKADKML